MSLRQLTITKSITSRKEESLGRYLNEISKIELVSAEEEIILARLIRSGDQKAKERLTKANLRFVISVAKQFQGQGLSLADLVNEGNIGLITAAERFDETKGFRFISYAIWWIRQSILTALAEGRTVRVPLNKVVVNNRIRRAAVRLEQQLEREASAEEIADELRINNQEVVSCLTDTGRCQSMDAPLGDTEDSTLLDVMEDPHAPGSDYNLLHNQSLKIEVERSLALLTKTQRTVLCAHYGIGGDRSLSLDEIADKLRVSRERVRQIKNKALEILKQPAPKSRLRSFVCA